LGLNHNKIMDRGVVAIADAMVGDHCPTPLKVGLLSNRMTGEGKRALEVAVKATMMEGKRIIALWEKNLLDHCPSL